MNISWLKLSVNIIDDQKIKIIRKFPDGNALFVLWIGLLCLAMRSARPGSIELTDGIPYSSDELAAVFDLEVKTVEMGISLFEKFGMIERIEGGVLEIINFRKHQNIDLIEHKRELTKRRVAMHRNRKALEDVTRYSVTVTQTELELDKEIDKEHEKKIPGKSGKIRDNEKLSHDTKLPIKPILDAFSELHANATGDKPMIDKKTIGIFSNLLKERPAETILAKLKGYYLGSYWFNRYGFSVEGFRRHYDEIKIQLTNPLKHDKISGKKNYTGMTPEQMFPPTEI